MRISDWSSDVCSSDLDDLRDQAHGLETLDTQIIEPGELDPPVVHGTDTLELLVLRQIQHGFAGHEHRQRFLAGEPYRAIVLGDDCRPGRSHTAADYPVAVIPLTALNPPRFSGTATP